MTSYYCFILVWLDLFVCLIFSSFGFHTIHFQHVHGFISLPLCTVHFVNPHDCWRCGIKEDKSWPSILIQPVHSDHSIPIHGNLSQHRGHCREWKFQNICHKTEIVSVFVPLNYRLYIGVQFRVKYRDTAHNEVTMLTLEHVSIFSF